MATTEAISDQPPSEDPVAARLRDCRLAEFFSGLATALDLLREAVEEMEIEDGLTEAGEHSYTAARAAIAAIASAEMSYYDDEGVQANFADYYHATGETPPADALEFSHFRIAVAGPSPLADGKQREKPGP